MIFNSVTYLLFLFAVTALYWLLPRRPRLWLILLSSIAFYGFWRVEFVPLLLLSAATDFFAARSIHASSNPARRKLFVLLSLAVNLGLLLYFKYLMFFAENVVGALNLFGFEVQVPAWKIVLPLGISFYTFQTISYTIDVYRGFIEPERSFVLYGCYVTFFPQLVAGPVLRAREVVEQLARRPRFDLSDLGAGLRRLLYGLFLKVVIADNIAPLVDSGFALRIEHLSALDVWTLAFMFGFQIYFDFSAYSHIALGSARVMGIRFPENFNFPFMASSPADFWRRWNISLSSWIRDYVFLPLSGMGARDRSVGGFAPDAPSRRRMRSIRALFLTWALMGLWHGANWTFVLWGLYFAIFIGIYWLGVPWYSRLPAWASRWGGWAVTLPVVMLSWVPFRAETLTAAFGMYARILDPAAYGWHGLRENTYLVAALIMLSIVATYAFRNTAMLRLRRFRPAWASAETAAFAVIIALVFIFLRPIKQFIYFQF